MGRLDQREMGAVRWLLGQIMVLISLLGGYALDLGADLLITISMAAVTVALFFPRAVESVPRWFWRVSPALLLVAIISDFIFAGGDFLPPLFRMVVFLTLYRALQIRSPREDLQLLLLTLFLLIVTGVLSLEVTFGLQLILYAPLAMGLLFVVNLAHRENADPQPETGPIFAGFSWRRLASRIRTRFDRRTLLAGCLLFLATTAMSLLFFILLPRFDIGAALPFPRLRTNQSLAGFSDHIQYGDVVSILDDDAIAMRVDVEMDAPPALPYWRMVVLDAYYDGGFLASPRVQRDRRLMQHYRFEFDLPRGFPPPDTSVWTLYLEGGISSYLPTGETFRTLRFNNRIALQLHELTRVLQATEINANTLSLRYEGMRFDGLIPIAPEDQLLPAMQPLSVDSSKPDYLREVAYPQTLLAVPGGAENSRILEEALAAMQYQPGMPPDAFSERLVRHLRTGRGYSLQTRIPDGEGETLLRWVDSGLPGHCELYAGAFVLLARHAGYPTRLVTGFVGGDWNGFENYFMVRNRNAHAWCEILDPRRGWLRVDPTPGYGANGGSVQDALAGGRLQPDRTWNAYLDSLRILWFRRVIQFDSEDQAVMAETMKGVGLRSADWLRERYSAFKELLEKDWKALVESGEWSGLLKDAVLPAGIGLILVVVGFWLRSLRRSKGYEAIMRRRAGRLLDLRRVRGLGEGDPVHARLQLIRYGPMASWPEGVEKVLRRRAVLRDENTTGLPAPS